MKTIILLFFFLVSLCANGQVSIVIERDSSGFWGFYNQTTQTVKPMSHYFLGKDTIYEAPSIPCGLRFVNKHGKTVKNINYATTEYCSSNTSIPVSVPVAASESETSTKQEDTERSFNCSFTKNGKTFPLHGKWCFVSSSIQADLKVYVDTDASRADVWIYEDAPSYFNTGDCGRVKIVTSLIQADVKVYQTFSSHDADLRIYFTKDRYKAGIR